MRFLWVALVVVSLPAAVLAAADSPRIGVLLFRPITPATQDNIRQGLRDLGYVDGQNVAIEWRSAEGNTDRVSALAAELVRANVAVIIAEFTPAVRAAKNATQTIPIVMAPAGDPVASGLVTSLARPGGNVTGFTNVAPELSGKRLEFLREIIPGLARIGLLIHGADPLDKAFVEQTRAAAAGRGIHVQTGEARSARDLETTLALMTKERVEAVIVQGNLPVPAQQVAKAAVRYRLPTISVLPQYAHAGGLMSYGASVNDIQRRAATYVDKLLKGARPADLPVEQPTKFELVINRSTARALGITIPASVLVRADQVID